MPNTEDVHVYRPRRLKRNSLNMSLNMSRRTVLTRRRVLLFVGLTVGSSVIGSFNGRPASALTPALDRNGFGIEVVTMCDRASSELDSLKNLYADETSRDEFVSYFSGLDRILVRMDTKLARLRVPDTSTKSIVTASRSALGYERKSIKVGLARGRTGKVAAARESINAAYVEIERRERSVNAQLVSIALDECSFFPTTLDGDTSSTAASSGPVVFGLDATDAAIVLPPVPGFTLTVLPEDSRTLPLDDASKALVGRYDGRLVYSASGKPVGALVVMKLRRSLDATEADAFFKGLFGSVPASPVDLPATGAFRRVQLSESGSSVVAGGVQGRWAVAVVASDAVGTKQFVAAYFPAVPLLPA